MEREAIDWRPRAGRSRVSLTGTVSGADGRVATALISNLNYKGCRVAANRDFAVGETVSLAISGRGRITGQVRWTRGSLAGVIFLTGDSSVDARRARIGV
jgi:hypothetical protein